MHAVKVHERPQPLFLTRCGNVAHRFRICASGIERHERLTRLPVAHQLDRPEHAKAAHVADRRVLVFKLLQLGPDHIVTDRARVLDNFFFLKDVDRGDRGGARQWVTAVCQAAWVCAILKRVGDLLADDYAAERNVARVDALGEADQVGRDIPVIDGEPLAAAPEAGHDFVNHHHDAVAIAKIAHALQIAGRGHENAVGADDCLEPDHRHGLRALDHQHVFEMLQCALTLLFFVGRVKRRAIRVRAPELDGASRARLVLPTARVAGQRNRGRSRAMVRAISRHNFVATGVQARHAYGILRGFGTAVGEEHHV